MSEPRLSRLPVARLTRNELWIIESADSKRLVKAYVGAHAEERRRTESRLLTYWAQAGYAAPSVFPMELDQIHRPHLVMSWIGARSLRDILCDTEVPIPDRLEMIQRVLDVAAERHAKAIRSSDLQLIRDDANTGNFLIDGDTVFHIDFERMPKSADLLDAAAVELAKLLRWIVRDLGRDQLDETLRRTIDAYRDQAAILRRIISRTCDRPGQLFHRFLDRRRRAHPGAITKYDIADGLQRLFV